MNDEWRTMFDYLRNLTKSAAEKQQEAMNAYLDDALSPKERRQFERLLVEDADLRLALEQRRVIKAQLRQLPRRHVPRNFMLDPAVYGRPQRQPLFQFYPVMRTAAVLTAFFFILAVATDLFVGQNRLKLGGAASDVAMVEAVEVTRIVTETVVEEGETVEMTRLVETFAETAVLDLPAVEEAMEVEEPAMAAEAPAEAEAIEDTTLAAAPEMEASAGEEDTAEASQSAVATTIEREAGAAYVDVVGTPTPALTMTPSPTDIAATKSTLPRPSAATITSDRGVTAVPDSQDEISNQAVAATAVPTPEPLVSAPITGLRWLQISLGALFIVLVLAVVYVRRQTF